MTCLLLLQWLRVLIEFSYVDVGQLATSIECQSDVIASFAWLKASNEICRRDLCDCKMEFIVDDEMHRIGCTAADFSSRSRLIGQSPLDSLLVVMFSFFLTSI